MKAAGLGTYPKQAILDRGDTRVTIRPLEPADGQRLLDFFLRVPEEERYYLKEDVTSREVIDRWVREIDYSRVVPLVAVSGEEIIADATLHRNRAGSRRHVGEIRVVVDPRYRNQGLGTLMVREVVDIAGESGLELVLFELVEGREDSAIQVAERLGFGRLATLQHLIKDAEGQSHNLAIMEMPLKLWPVRWDF